MTHLPGQRAVQDGDEQGLRRVERGEEVGQQQRRSRQEHEARRPGDALQEEQRQGAHRPRPADGGEGGGAGGRGGWKKNQRGERGVNLSSWGTALAR